MDVVWIRKRKRPLGSGLWGAYDLGQDAYGTWLFTPGGSLFRGEDGSVWDTCEVSQSSPGGPGWPTIYLIPATGWWIACWRGPEPISRVDIDISTPPRLVGRVWGYDDLELDPFVTQDGVTGCQDADEFAQACAAGLISAAEERHAVAAAELLDLALGQRTPPFDSTGDDRLAEATALGLAPLTDLAGLPVLSRPTARVLLVDDRDRLLLFRTGDHPTAEPGSIVRWFPPGGGVQPGETPQDAARRELREETGLEVGRLDLVGVGDPWTGGSAGDDVETCARYFLARTSQATMISTSGFEPLERATITGHRWWTVDELAQTDDVLRPTGLADWYAELLAEGVPDLPTRVQS